MSTFYDVGSWVWVRHNGGLEAAKVVSNSPTESVFQVEMSKEQIKLPVANITRENVTPMHQTSIDSVEDMSTLSDLHEAAILHNIRQRYAKDNVYTFIGSILAAVNPYKPLPIYDSSTLQSYNRKVLGELAPHIYAIANEAYYSMMNSKQNQCVLISGESGAGKTESTKFILKYLSALSSKESLVEQQILQSGTILEAFGNAKTVYNNNSSRFGKYISVQFNEHGAIEGAKLTDYLLEKSRVVRQNPMERNYHIFYQLFAGMEAAEKETLKLTKPIEQFHYLNQSGCTSDPSIDDKKDYERVRSAMKVMSFTNEQTQDLLKSIAGILHLGNISFSQEEGQPVKVKNPADAATTAGFLGIDTELFNESLTTRKISLRGESITSPLELSAADDSRDSLAMNIYVQLFSWIIARINRITRTKDTLNYIGVLDIFGFENFKVNSFEQFCINYANERLQMYFNQHIFSLEQAEYSKENINWSDIKWVDNQACIDMIERHLGLLSLLDEESRFPKGTDATMLQKFHDQHEAGEHYIKPRMAAKAFGIKHYAGDVIYEVAGFLDKNRDTFREDLIAMLQESKSDFIYDLFEKVGGAEKGKGARKKPTVSSQFKDSLASLMQALGVAHPFFVRCIKPNMKKTSETFDAVVVMNQLRYSGMLETVRIRRTGYPVRRTFADFLYRYKVLTITVGGVASNLKADAKLRCQTVLSSIDSAGTNWQLGLTKIFLRESLEATLEKTRQQALQAVANKIKSRIMGYIQRKRFLKAKRNVVVVQKLVRGFLARRRFRKAVAAAIVIQTNFRGFSARKLRAKLLEIKRIEEEKRKAEERRKEEERRREMERLEKENKMRELEELRRKAEQEAKQRAEEEAAKKAAAAKEQAEAAAKARVLAERLEAEEKERKRLEAERIEAELAEAQRKAEEAAYIAERDAVLQELNDLGNDEGALQEDMISLSSSISGGASHQGGGGGGSAADGARKDSAARDSIFSNEEEEEDDGGEEGEEGEAIDIDFEALKLLREGTMYRHSDTKVKKSWKRKYCVLRDGYFIVFGSKPTALKSGWVIKQSGAVKAWTRLFLVLTNGTLAYYKSSDEGEEAVNVLALNKCSGIFEATGSINKENAFGVIMPKKTYYFCTDTVDERATWVDLLRKVHTGMNDRSQLRKLETEKLDYKNAQEIIETRHIVAIAPTLPMDDMKNCFTISTHTRAYTFATEGHEDMIEWSLLLLPKTSKMEQKLSGSTMEGYLAKKMKTVNRRRYVVLKDDTIRYYKKPEDPFAIDSVQLNSLCTVVPPVDIVGQVTRQWTFVVNTRKRTLTFTAKTSEDAQAWVNAIQDVIDNKPPIETKTEKLISELKSVKASHVGAIYAAYPILTYSRLHISSSLLPLPYGFLHHKSRTLLMEALSNFKTILEVEKAKDPVPAMQTVLRTALSIAVLRSEIFVQAIKQTINHPQPGSIEHLRYWHLLTALCNITSPARKVQRYLRFYLKRVIEQTSKTSTVLAPIIKLATICLSTMDEKKKREFAPSRLELEAIAKLQDVQITVSCVGDRSCTIPIYSNTTIKDVLVSVAKALQMSEAKNRFALFEETEDFSQSHLLDDKFLALDVLAKWDVITSQRQQQILAEIQRQKELQQQKELSQPTIALPPPRTPQQQAARVSVSAPLQELLKQQQQQQQQQHGAPPAPTPRKSSFNSADPSLLYEAAVTHRTVEEVAEALNALPTLAPSERWRFVYRILSFMEVDFKKIDNPLEAETMFEQAHYDLIQYRVPMADEQRIKLTALRLQAKLGDCDVSKDIPDIRPYYPILLPSARATGGADKTGSPMSSSKLGTIRKTFNTFRKGKKEDPIFSGEAPPVLFTSPSKTGTSSSNTSTPVKRTKSASSVFAVSEEEEGVGETGASDLSSASQSSGSMSSISSSSSSSSPSSSAEEKKGSKFGTLMKGVKSLAKIGTISSGSSIASTLRKAQAEEEETVDPFDLIDLKLITAQIDEQWINLAGTRKPEAMRQYMSIVTFEWPYYGSAIYEVENTGLEIWPKELTLVVNLKGLTILKTTGERVGNYPFYGILSYSAPNATTLKFSVDGLGKITLETPKAVLITKLMGGYIDELTKRQAKQ